MNKVIGLLLLCTLVSCTGSRLVKGKIKDLPAETVMAEMESSLVNATTLSGKAKVDVEGDGIQQVTVDFTLQTDSFIGVSVRALGIEFVRAFITPDSIRIIDRINKQYIPKDISYIQTTYGVPIDFMVLQELLLGRPVWADNTWYPVVDEDAYHFKSNTVSVENELLLYPTFLLKEQLVKDTNNNRSIWLAYAGYKKTGGYAFSMSRQIQVDAVEKYAIHMEWASLTLNDPVSFDFKVNPKYEVVH
jgi:hypothetical protein